MSLVLAGCGGSSSEAADPTPEPVDVGQSITVADVTFTVHSVERVTPRRTGMSFLDVKEGHDVLVIDVGIENERGHEISMFSDLEWNVRDADGRSFDDEYVSGVTNEPEIDDVPANGRSRGVVIVPVLETSSGFILAVTLDEPTGDINIFDATAIATAWANPRQPLGHVTIDLGI